MDKNMEKDKEKEAYGENNDAVASGVVVAGVVERGPELPSGPALQTHAGRVTPGRRVRDNARRGGRGGTGRGSRRPGPSRERAKPEFDSRIIDIRRVTRVTAGGRRMNFSVAVAVGDGKGRVGVGLGKGADTAAAMDKAAREARKSMIKVPLSASRTIPHAVEAKLGASEIKIFPARGRGIVAGGSARAVIELCGIRDVCVKIMSGSKNRLNNAKVAVEALGRLISASKEQLRSAK